MSGKKILNLSRENLGLIKESMQQIKAVEFVAPETNVGKVAMFVAASVIALPSFTTEALAAGNDVVADSHAYGVVADLDQTPTLKVVDKNGHAIVDIVNPDRNGVSDNRFTKLSTAKGVIFKNNKDAKYSQVLKQKIAANPNLVNEAKVILAQVTGNNKSVIKGALEVLGVRADLMVINPNGVDLNGVELVNVKEFTASTAEVNANNAVEQEIRRGKVTVNNSLTSKDVDLLRVIAQAVELNGQIKLNRKNGKAADAVVSAGKQRFLVKNNTAKGLEAAVSEEPKLAISGSAFGSMYGDKVQFIVSESGAGIDYAGDLFANNVEITAAGNVKVSGVKADVAKVSAKGNVEFAAKASKSTRSKRSATSATEARAGVEVGNLEVQGENVKLGAGAKVQAQTASLKANKKLDAKDASLKARSLALSAETVESNQGSSLQASKVKLDSDKVQKLSGATKTALKADQMVAHVGNLTSQDQVTKAEALIKELQSNSKVLLVDNVTVAKDTKLEIREVNEFAVTNSFVNHGLVNLSQRDLANLQLAGDAGHEVLVSTGKNFENYGLLIADKLNVKSKGEINLAGLTYVLNDLVLLSPKVVQTGNLEVKGDLNVYADTYKLQGKLEGAAKVDSAHGEKFQHFADHSLRRDRYTLEIATGDINVDGVNVVGGTVKVGKNLTLKPLTDEAAKKFNSDFVVGGTVVTSPNRLDAVNAEIFVGGNFVVDGAVSNLVETLDVKLVDLLKAKSNVVLKFQPRTWINTGLMIEKVQKFDSLYSLLDNIFQQAKTMSWYNGGYRMRPEHLLDTFRAGVKDSYNLKLFAAVLGADWRKANYDTLKARWVKFKANQEASVTLYAPGANIVAENFTQSGGDFVTGVDASHTLVAKDQYQAKGETVEVKRANFGNKKIQRKHTDAVTLIDKEVALQNAQRSALARAASLDLFEDEESPVATTAVTETPVTETPVATTETPASELNNAVTKVTNLIDAASAVSTKVSEVELQSVSGLKALANGKAGEVAAQTDPALAAMLIDSVVSQVGYALINQKGATQLVNELVSNTKTYNQKKAEADLWYQSKLQIASEAGKKLYKRDYDKKLVNLAKRYDHIEFVEVNGKLQPVAVLGAHTLNKLSKFMNSASTVVAKEKVLVDSKDHNVEVNHATLNAKSLVLKGDNLAVKGVEENSAIVASSAELEGNKVEVAGNLVAENFVLKAKEATLSGNAVYDEDGCVTHKGGVAADNLKVEVEDQLTLNAYNLEAKEKATVKAGAVNMQAELGAGSSFDVQGVGADIGTVTNKRAFYKVEGSSVSGKKVEVEATKADVTVQSSAVQGEETAVIKAANDFQSVAKHGYTEHESHEENISVDGFTGIQFAGYKAAIKAKLASNDGKVSAEPEFDKGAKLPNQANFGLSFSYKTVDTKEAEKVAANSAIDGKSVQIIASKNAEIGNLDLNAKSEATGSDAQPKVAIKADSVTTTQAKNEREAESHSSEFKMSLGLTASSAIVDTMATTVKSIAAGSNDQEVDPTLALSILSNLEELIIKPIGVLNLKAKFGGSYSNSHTVGESEGMNTYKGDLDINTTAETQLKAIDGADLNNVKIKAEHLEISSATESETTKSNKQSFGISADANLVLSKSGLSANVGGTTDISASWKTSEATKHNNSNLNAKTLEVKATTAELKGTTAKAQDVKLDVRDLVLKSEQDTVKERETGFSVNAGGGVGISAAGFADGFGWVNGGINHTRTDTAKVGEVTKIEGTNSMKVESDHLDLTGAHLVTKGKSDLKVKEVSATSIKDTHKTDGGNVDFGFNLSKDGVSRYNLGGGRNDQEVYEAEVNASVIGGKVHATVDGKLNQEEAKAVDVTTNKKVQGTSFKFSYSKAIREKIVEKAKTAKETTGKVVDKVRGTHRADLAKESSDKDSGNVELISVKPLPEAGNSTPAPTTGSSAPAASTPAPAANPAPAAPATSASTTTSAPAATAPATTAPAPATTVASNNANSSSNASSSSSSNNSNNG